MSQLLGQEAIGAGAAEAVNLGSIARGLLVILQQGSAAEVSTLTGGRLEPERLERLRADVKRWRERHPQLVESLKTWPVVRGLLPGCETFRLRLETDDGASTWTLVRPRAEGAAMDRAWVLTEFEVRTREGRIRYPGRMERYFER